LSQNRFQTKLTRGADFFPGFRQFKSKTSGAVINAVMGGKGPGLLLLHGYPQTHIIWRKIATQLAGEFALVIPDLRGYGDSSKPADSEGHSAYSKRAMAQDQVELMGSLGSKNFGVIGHDRGGRVAHRMALDHADAVEKLVVIDIVPTYRLYRHAVKSPGSRPQTRYMLPCFNSQEQRLYAFHASASLTT
jgi:haloacetate dehalogenase